jgi:dUTPase
MSSDEIPIFKFAIREDLQDWLETTGVSPRPHQATPLSTGWDVRACQKDRKELLIRAGRYVKIPLGFRMLPPPGWWAELRPRSSSFAKKNLHALYGVLDEDYEGECIFACHYLPDTSDMCNDLTIRFGDPIGQIIPVKRQLMIPQTISNQEYDQECLNRSATRGAGGFGSTQG